MEAEAEAEAEAHMELLLAAAWYSLPAWYSLEVIPTAVVLKNKLIATKIFFISESLDPH